MCEIQVYIDCFRWWWVGKCVALMRGSAFFNYCWDPESQMLIVFLVSAIHLLQIFKTFSLLSLHLAFSLHPASAQPQHYCLQAATTLNRSSRAAGIVGLRQPNLPKHFFCLLHRICSKINRRINREGISIRVDLSRPRIM